MNAETTLASLTFAGSLYSVNQPPLFGQDKAANNPPPAGLHSRPYCPTHTITPHRQPVESAQLFQSLFEDSSDLIVFQNQAGVILDVNPALLALMKRPKSEVVNQELDKFLPPVLIPVLKEKLASAFQGAKVSFELAVPFHGIDNQIFSVVLFPMAVAGNIQGVHLVARAINSGIWDKQADAQKTDLVRTLTRQNQDLQQFTYMVAHNLRAPVANAIGLSDLLPRVINDSALFNMTLTYLKDSVTSLDIVLKDLNHIISIRDTIDDTASQVPVEVALVCQEAIKSLQKTLQDCGAQVLVQIPDGTQVRGNRAYLYSIFFNLLSNAIQYRSVDRPLTIYIKVGSRPDKGTRISVSDNGRGFDRRKAGTDLFKLYKRFHTRSEGRGIGLFLVKTHLDTMNGSIEASSQVEVGTRFLLHLPFAGPAGEEVG